MKTLLLFEGRLNKVWQFLKKLNIYISYDPDISLAYIYPREMKICIFKVLQRLKMVHPSPGKWINNP